MKIKGMQSQLEALTTKDIDERLNDLGIHSKASRIDKKQAEAYRSAHQHNYKFGTLHALDDQTLKIKLIIALRDYTNMLLMHKSCRLDTELERMTLQERFIMDELQKLTGKSFTSYISNWQRTKKP